MALTKEDGSGVSGANTYVLAADARAYAAARGVALPTADADLEPMLLKAMDYAEGLRARYCGGKTYTGVPGYWSDYDGIVPLPSDVDAHPAQPLQWPRVNVLIDGVPLSCNAIPLELTAAVCQCVMEISSGNDLTPNATGQFVKREKVDVLETEYMTAQDMGFAADFKPSYPKVDALLAPLFSSSGVLETVRV